MHSPAFLFVLLLRCSVDTVVLKRTCSLCFLCFDLLERRSRSQASR